MTNEIPLPGYLGINMTCEMVGRPNEKIRAAPLHPIPVFEEPFSRVIMDCVGLVPRAKSGNKYLLTIMCASSSFPEAIPLRNISDHMVVKALIRSFTKVGLPKVIQTGLRVKFYVKSVSASCHAT